MNRRKPARRRRVSRSTAVLAGLAGLLLLACIARLLVGDQFGWPPWSILRLRLDRLAIGLTVGSALAVAGVLLQALFRNPLASPYILGVSTGAAVGVMVAIYLAGIGVAGLSTALALGADHFAALAGAVLTMLAVYVLAQKRGFVDPLGLLLVGVVINAINGAAIMFLNYMTPHGTRPKIALWMMGYFNDAMAIHWPIWSLAFWTAPIVIVFFVTLVGVVLAAGWGRAMDVATLSDPEAAALGLNVPMLRLALFGLAGILTAGTVVLAGPIAFVGLICPHLVRLLVGPGHRTLVIGSALAGATLIIGADVLIKGANVGQGLMPIGVLTALIGGPIFLFLLRPQLGRGGDA